MEELQPLPVYCVTLVDPKEEILTIKKPQINNFVMEMQGFILPKNSLISKNTIKNSNELMEYVEEKSLKSQELIVPLHRLVVIENLSYQNGVENES